MRFGQGGLDGKQGERERKTNWAFAEIFFRLVVGHFGVVLRSVPNQGFWRE